MSITVCPWCKAPLVLKDDILVCGNTDCPACDEKYLHEELIRTHKALDVAVDALKKYTDASGNWWYGYEFQGHYEDYAGEYADKALEQITALTKGGDNE